MLTMWDRVAPYPRRHPLMTYLLGKYFSDGVFELKTTAGEMWDYDEFQEFMSRPLDPDEDRIDTLRARGRELMGSEQFEDDFSILEIVFH